MHLVSLDIKNKDEEISQFLIIERLTMFQFILRKKLIKRSKCSGNGQTFWFRSVFVNEHLRLFYFCVYSMKNTNAVRNFNRPFVSISLTSLARRLPTNVCLFLMLFSGWFIINQSVVSVLPFMAGNRLSVFVYSADPLNVFKTCFYKWNRNGYQASGFQGSRISALCQK